MKKIFFLIALTIVSCSKLLDGNPNLSVTHQECSLTMSPDSNSRGVVLDTLRNGMVVENRDSIYVFQSDMLFKEDDLWLIEGNCNRSASMIQSRYYWPGNVVYYEADSDFLNSNYSSFESAKSAISSRCGIEFVQRQYYHPNYIHFQLSQDINNSYLGMVGGEQIINIAPLQPTYTIIHEIMHALGFFHEQSRSDRDFYIRVNLDNVAPENRHNFSKFTDNNYLGYNYGTFDFSSVMLYGSFDFALNSSVPVMTKLDGTRFGGGTSLSIGDINALRAIYGPPYHRMETIIEEVLEDSMDYTREVYSTRRKTVIRFYADEGCTIAQSTNYPRIVGIKLREEYCDAYNDLQIYTSNFDFIVPEGVDSIVVDEYVNYEEYLYSDPARISTKTYSIINYQVPNILIN